MRPDHPGVAFGVMRVAGEPWLHHLGKPLLPASELWMAGPHGCANALAALAMASVLVPDVAALVPALRTFTGLPYRLERVLEHDGITWFDDSKATNPAAVEAAIQTLSERFPNIVLIAGGVAKGAEFTSLRRVLEKHVSSAILIGQDADVLQRAWSGVSALLPAGEMARAVALAAEVAKAGDAVLLAPACASFDQYRDYADRGDHFQRLVRAQVAGLAQERAP